MFERTRSPLSAMRTFSSSVLPSEPGAPFGHSRISLGKSEAWVEAAINTTKPNRRRAVRSERLICLRIIDTGVTGAFVAEAFPIRKVRRGEDHVAMFERFILKTAIEPQINDHGRRSETAKP